MPYCLGSDISLTEGLDCFATWHCWFSDLTRIPLYPPKLVLFLYVYYVLKYISTVRNKNRNLTAKFHIMRLYSSVYKLELFNTYFQVRNRIKFYIEMLSILTSRENKRKASRENKSCMCLLKTKISIYLFWNLLFKVQSVDHQHWHHWELVRNS